MTSPETRSAPPKDAPANGDDDVGSIPRHATNGSAKGVKYARDKPPPRMPVIAENIPDELKALPQWVCWRWEWDAKAEKGAGKWTKPPYQTNGFHAASTRRRTWAAFSDVVARVGEWSGIGIAITDDDPIVGLDYDNCVDADRKLTPEAQAFVDRFDSYAEYSPSGAGIRVFIRGKLPPEGNRRGDVEMYEKDRYLTVTGHRIPGTPASVNERQDVLSAVHAEIWPEHSAKKKKPAPKAAATAQTTASDYGPEHQTGRVEIITDDDVVMIASAAQNGARFRALWAGDWQTHYNSQSEADLSLCGILAFYTGKETARIDALFRRSGLWRPKWDEKRGVRTYGERTVDKAVSGCTKSYAELSSDADFAEPRVSKSVAEAAPEADSATLPDVPLSALPDRLGEYCERAAEAFRSHPAMVLPTMLATAAAAVGRAADVNVDGGKWREISNLWLANIAKAGGIKSPTLKDVSAPLTVYNRELGAEHALRMENYDQRCAEIKAKSGKGKAEQLPERPRRVQAIVSDTTIEALANVLEVSPRLLGRYDELAALFRAMGCYKSRGGHDQEAWKSLASGAEIIVNRKTDRHGDPLIIPNPRISMIGCITTENAAKLFHVTGDVGSDSVDRWHFIMPPAFEAGWKVRPMPPLLEVGWHNAIKALCSLPTDTSRLLLFSGDAQDRFGELFVDVQRRRTHAPGFLSGVLGKFCGQVARIALVLALMTDIESKFVEVEDVEAAITIGEWLLAHTTAARRTLLTMDTASPMLSDRAGRAVALMRRKGRIAAAGDFIASKIVANAADEQTVWVELETTGVARRESRTTTAGRDVEQLRLLD